MENGATVRGHMRVTAWGELLVVGWHEWTSAALRLDLCCMLIDEGLRCGVCVRGLRPHTCCTGTSSVPSWGCEQRTH